MTIQLEGLTQQQYQIADLLWNCDSQESVDQLKQSLPKSYQRDAETIHQMMIAAVMDQHEDITEDVRDMIQSLR
jgi:hypothetical protein